MYAVTGPGLPEHFARKTCLVFPESTDGSGVDPVFPQTFHSMEGPVIVSFSPLRVAHLPVTVQAGADRDIVGRQQLQQTFPFRSVQGPQVGLHGQTETDTETAPQQRQDLLIEGGPRQQGLAAMEDDLDRPVRI